MDVINTPVQDVVLLVPQVYGDNRGYFMETFRDDWFKKNVADISFVQDNQSKSSRGILRGLHYQVNRPQGKLVRVVSGVVYDVALDLRRSSPSFGEAFCTVLSADNKHQLWVPPGFAHGFYVMSESAEFVYKCSDYYIPEDERSIIWNDPVIGIDWPLVNGLPPLLSTKDEAGVSLSVAECFR